MNIKEKLQLERADEKVIQLYHEGIFYTAYGYSAVRVKKSFYPEVCLLEQRKKDGSSYFRVGIVHNSSALNELTIKDADGNFVPSLTIPYTGKIFDLGSVVPDRIVSSSNRKDRVSKYVSLSEISFSSEEKQIIDDIRSLDLASLTPLKAMLHILTWVEQLQKANEEDDV